MKTKQLLVVLLLSFYTISFAKSDDKQPTVNLTSVHSASAFVENVGQVFDQHQNARNDIQFVLGGRGINVFIGYGKLQYQWQKNNNGTVHDIDGLLANTDSVNQSASSMYRMDAELVGASENAQIIKEEKGEYYERYYKEWTPVEGITANSYYKITYKDIYPHIDWILYLSNGQLKQEFRIRPGGNVSDIKMKYSGANRLSINTDNSFTAETPMGTIHESAPVSYTTEGIVVDSRYNLDGNLLMYHVEEYSGTLIIDPDIDWATYFGAANTDFFHSVTIDENGDTYMCGSTYSTSAIATTGAHQLYWGGGLYPDGVIAKFTSSGSRAWSTYYGGMGRDNLININTVGSSGIVIVGNTDSPNGVITISGGGAGIDGLLINMDNTGKRIWATRIGGNSDDYLYDVVYKNGFIYTAGYTNSTSGITTSGAYQKDIGGLYDMLIAGYNMSGAKLWATYFGDALNDFALGIDIHSSGDLIICGQSSSSNSIASNGSYQAVRAGKEDGVVARFNSSGTNRAWATYYGGSEKDEFRCVRVSASDDIYAVGSTFSPTNISVSSVYQASHGGGEDILLLKMNDSGTPQWCTYYGDTGRDYSYMHQITKAGNILLAGVTTSTKTMTNANAYQSNIGGGTDGLLGLFNPNGSRLYGSYIGGQGIDVAMGVAEDTAGNIFVGGYTNSTNGIFTQNGFQKNNNGEYDMYLAKFCNNPNISLQPMDVTAQDGQNISFTVAATGNNLKYLWETDMGLGFQNIINSGQYSGANTPTLTLSAVTPNNNNHKFRCVVSSSNCKTISTVSELFVWPTDVKDIYQSQVQVYPLPASNIVTISSTEVISKLEILNLLGQKVIAKSTNSKSVDIDVNSLSRGTYIIKINDIHTSKLIKQ